MANKVTPAHIQQFNELYYKYHNYAEVARQTGFASTTVKKYIIKDYVPQEKRQIKRFEGDLPEEFNIELFTSTDNWGDFLTLSDSEKQEMEALWKELDQ